MVLDRDKVCMVNNTAYWIKYHNKMNGNCYSQASLKHAVKYLLQNYFSKVGSQIFHQIIGNSFPIYFYFMNLKG